MNISESESADLNQTCLSKLNELLKKVKRQVQIRFEQDMLNQYRVGYQISQPKTLVGGELKTYQLEALDWMINLASQSANAILADDMGLGKTIQAISYLAYLKQQHGVLGKHLIICPKSVCRNWLNEITKWMPMLRAHILPGTMKQKEEVLSKIIKPKKYDVIITTYESAKTNFGFLSRIAWEVMIIDQAHKIKNYQSRNFIFLKHYRSSFKLLLTGTPLSNNISQLWSLLNFIMPDIFDDRTLFEQIQNSTIQFEGTEAEKLAYQCKIAKYFHKIIEPFFKRRTKKTLELGLPPKIQSTIYVPLSKLQLTLYRNLLKYKSVYGESGSKQAHQMQYRKICQHPYLIPHIEPENEPLYGEHLIESCGKMKVLDKLLKKLINQKHKVLLFSQFVIQLDILQDYCQYRNYTYCRLDGNTQLQTRQEYMNQFNNTDKFNIFLLSTRSGGLGINLIGADRVIIYDIDWNPQNDNQAMDRAYRIGQKNTVHVYKLVTEYTIEERMLQFQRYKLIWDELVIQKGGFMGKIKNQDPFSDIKLDDLALLGKGQIFRLQPSNEDIDIDTLIEIAQQKDKIKSDQIKKKFQKKIEEAEENQLINPFDMEKDTETEEFTAYHFQRPSKRRNIVFDKREWNKFQRLFVLPPHKFYIDGARIRQLEYELFIELKKQQSQRDQEIIKEINKDLAQAKAKGRFDQWSFQDFQNFIEAHREFLYNEYQNIASKIQGKTASQVQQYSQYFLKKAPNNEFLISQFRKLQNYQKAVKNKKQIQKIVVQKSKADSQSIQNQGQSNSDQNWKKIEKNLKEVKQKQQRRLKKEQQKRIKQQKKLEMQQAKKKALEQKQIQKENLRIKKQKEKIQREQAKKLKEQEKIKKAQERKKLEQERRQKRRLEEIQREKRKEERQKKQKQKIIEAAMKSIQPKKTRNSEQNSKISQEIIIADDSKQIIYANNHEKYQQNNKNLCQQHSDKNQLDIVTVNLAPKSQKQYVNKMQKQTSESQKSDKSASTQLKGNNKDSWPLAF